MNSEIQGFNVRVYGICIRDGLLLTLREQYGTWDIVKLPGGGLEYGKGVVDCLKREFMEELNLDIVVGECFYVQRDYIPSIVSDNRQILILYFEVEIINVAVMKICDSHVSAINWLPITSQCPLTLPIDNIMYDLLKTRYL